MTGDARSDISHHKAYVEAPTGQVHYRTVGDGRPLMLLHQSPLSSLMFEPVYQRLASAGFRCIGVDTPGFGMSDVPTSPPTVSDYAEVLPLVLDALGLDQCVVLGHHTGAAIGCELAVLHPARVSHLILNGPPVFDIAERSQWMENLPHDPEPRLDGGHLVEIWQRRLRSNPGWSDVRAIQRTVIQRLLAGETEWYGHRAVFSYDMEASLRRVRMPSLIFTNTGDSIYEQAQRAHALRPDFAYVELAGGTNMIVDEQPEAWTAVVVNFLSAE